MSILDLDLSKIDLDLDQIDMEVVLKDNFFLKKPDLSDKRADEFLEAKIELEFFFGLVALTEKGEPIRPSIINLRNKAIEKFYLAKFRFHQEYVLQQFYGTHEGSKGNLLTIVETEGARLEDQKYLASKYPEGSEQRIAWEKRSKIMQKTVDTAKSKLSVIAKAEASTWKPPSYDDLKELAKKDNVYFSEAQKRYERSLNYTHLVPDWMIDYAEHFNKEHLKYVDSTSELNPREYRWVQQAKNVLKKENNKDKHFDLMMQALEKYWTQVTRGFEAIESHFLDVTIDDFIKTKSAEKVEVIHPELAISTGLGGMGGFFDKLLKIVLSPVALFANSVAKKILDKTVGKIIPEKWYGKLSALNEAQVNVLKGKLDKESFRQAVDAVKDVAKIVATAYQRMNVYALKYTKGITNSVFGDGAFETLDRYTGGIATSYENLNKTAVVVVDSEGKAKVDWARTAFDAIKIATVASGGSAVFSQIGASAGGQLVTEKTSLGESSFGRTIVQAGQAYITGGQSAVKKVAVTKGAEATIKQTGLDKSKLGSTLAKAGTAYAVKSTEAGGVVTATDFAKEYGTEQAQKATAKASQATVGKALTKATGSQAVGDVFAQGTAQVLGPTATTNAINSNPSFSEKMKETARQKAVEVGKKMADEELKKRTGIGISDLEKIYELKDKSVQEIVDEAQRKLKERMNAGYVKEKAQAEADRFIKKRLEEAYGLPKKYGQKLLDYLFWKYGPQYDYDHLIQPNDYLQYQVYILQPNQRVFQFGYTNYGVVYGALGVLALGTAYYLYED